VKRDRRWELLISAMCSIKIRGYCQRDLKAVVASVRCNPFKINKSLSKQTGWKAAVAGARAFEHIKM
jgi:hypothetical protein